MLKKLKRNLLISIAVAGLLYLGFTIYADFGHVVQAFRNFNWLFLPLLLLCSSCNYMVRFSKWDYYLRIIGVKISKIDSLSVFMSGLVMSVTPGKMGELLKAYLLKEITGTSISKSAPIIFVERITDFVSLMLIALAGAYYYNYGRTIVLIVALIFFLIIIFLSNRTIADPVLKLMEKNKFLNKHLAKIHNAYESSYQMLRPLPLLKMTVVSLFSWFFECLGYYLILRNFPINLHIPLLWSAFSYCFAIIIGAVSMLPGGLGVTEGSLTFMLVEKGVSNQYAVASTFIIRAVTLWFAVLIGVISVSLYQKRFGKIIIEPEIV
ncbi:MAG: lysylphosphatidylglycerol synthase transmembrane domain-containing protein [Ignavibacteriaceae bacterium]|nr:lysylphosphatidylglycerol synthase transmembrane domain-containing protein [Ignavibacteriaceae bacterium]